MAFSSELLEERPGFISVLFEGEKAAKVFQNEAGGHRYQGQSKGRTHTSTVTVAVLFPTEVNSSFSEHDVDFKCVIGTGPGGQHRQKNATCVIATHIPTGITARIDTRSQHRNKQIALQILRIRVAELEQSKLHSSINNIRKDQIGSGMRADKVRTYREVDDQVKDHRTNKKWALTKWMKGEWS